jgi:hypothetical protein
MYSALPWRPGCLQDLVTACHRTECELGCRLYVTRVISETEACSYAHEFL